MTTKEIRKIVYVDMDGVLCDFNKRAKNHPKKELFPGRPDLLPDIFKDLDLIDGAKEALDKLNQKFEIFFFNISYLFLAGMVSLFRKLKSKWGITSNFQFFIINLVFAISGFTSLFISRPLLSFFGVNSDLLSWYIYYPLRILIIFIAYQFTLLIVAFLFGQFGFFWKQEKKILRRIGFKIPIK